MERRTLEEVIKALDNCTSPVLDGCIYGCPYSHLVEEGESCDEKAIPEMQKDALHYLKEYQKILPLVPSLINTAIAVQKKGKTIG